MCDLRPNLPKELRRLTRIGLNGANAERNLQRWVLRQHWRRALPMAVEFTVPMQNAEGQRHLHNVFLPHLTFRPQPWHCAHWVSVDRVWFCFPPHGTPAAPQTDKGLQLYTASANPFSADASLDLRAFNPCLLYKCTTGAGQSDQPGV